MGRKVGTVYAIINRQVIELKGGMESKWFK